MKKPKKVVTESKWLKSLGAHINNIIISKGYKSPYEFWIEKGENQFSRVTLNSILNGTTDVKISTLRTISKLLGITLTELIDVK